MFYKTCFIEKIQYIGRFFPQDKKGFILNDASLQKVSSHWLPVIEKIKNSYLENLGKKVHSIYLRGSVPRGLAIDGVSDVDIFALVHGFNHRWEKASWQTELEEELRRGFYFVKNVEVMLSQFTDDFLEKNPRLAMVIKTQSVCIYGNDWSEKIPLFFPDKKMILNLTFLEEDISDFLKKEKITASECSEIMKTLVRSGFELVMEKAGKYTPDLYLCYHTFSDFFPKKEKAMRKVLHYYLNPVEDVFLLKKVVKEMGEWILNIQKT